MEYRLFGQVTRALIDASKTDPSDLSTRMDALDWNRRMWSTLAEACASPENELPHALRAQFISLSIWVSKYTSAVIRREDDIEALIDVNKMIMQGLAGDTAEAA
jgi:flagellar biosynthesis activator protein FlaF